MVCPGILSKAHFEQEWLQSVAWLGGGEGGGGVQYGFICILPNTTVVCIILT